MQTTTSSDRIYCRTLWISDVHLGNLHCKADQLLTFLDRVECRTLYLVGDIIDVWSMSKRVYWPESHTKVLRKLMQLSHGDTDVIYIPGNHDANFREFCGADFHNIRVRRQVIHETGRGKRMLVSHGDELDYAVRYSRLNRFIGDIAYDLLMWVNRRVNQLRRLMGVSYWSLAKWVKVNVAQAEAAINAYQHAAINLVREKGLDGIICGHLHYPVLAEVDGLLYCNDGDWVENCTALVEDFNGDLQLINGLEQRASLIQMVYPRVA